MCDHVCVRCVVNQLKARNYGYLIIISNFFSLHFEHVSFPIGLISCTSSE